MGNYELLALGMVNALGADTESVGKAIFERPLASPLTVSSEYLLDAEVPVGKLQFDLPRLPKEYSTLDSRFSRILLHLYRQIESSVSELKRIFPADRIAVVLGSSTSGIEAAEEPFIFREAHGYFPDSYMFLHQEIGAGSKLLARVAGVTGPAYTISTACSSSAKVFATAKNLLELGICDAVILGGVDSLCKMTVRGFSSLDLISTSRSNPMSSNRDGLNIGEGGALFTMVKGSAGVQLRGVGETSDAYHISTPHPEGQGASTAIEYALAAANCSASDVSYLNLHGTGTRLNDSMESAAVARVLGLETPCSSTKPLTGHLLGAAAACEIGFCWLSLNAAGNEKPLPQHVWDGSRDEILPHIRLVDSGESVRVSRESVFLSNSFAFGGSNACVALGLGTDRE